uniref:EF-hand domain-containing protein n=1 Tax=Glossina austeni TaxID=7395 RepID=A0A1A9VX30_GLOAU
MTINKNMTISNGYIEGTELDGFLREFVASANATDVSPEAVTDTMLEELKSCFMEAYDDNQDGKIDIRELAQLLPMEENFLLLFRFDNPLESSIWREYDTDNSGYIEADELKNFLRDLLKEAKKINDVSEDKLIEYTDTMLYGAFQPARYHGVLAKLLIRLKIFSTDTNMSYMCEVTCM